MGHFYAIDGTPVYEVPKKSGAEGEMRDTTVRDARQLGLVASTTTISSIIAAPGLDRWKTMQVLDASWEIDKTNKKKEWWVAEVMKEAQKITEESSKRGSQIHDKLEKWIESGSYDGVDKIIVAAIPEINQIFKGLGINKEDLIVEKSFAHPLGFGGKIDLHSVQGDGWVIDHKTKNTDDVSKMKGFDNHIIQLASYREGINKPKARCGNIFISTVTPGVVVFEEYTEEQLQRGWEMFKAAMRLWQLQNNMECKL